MKKPIFSFSLFGLLITFSFFTLSCGGDEASAQENGKMTATVDGKAWKADMVSAIVLQGIFNISGLSDDESSIIMTLDGLQVGEYISDATTANALIWQPGSGALGYTSLAQNAAGEVVITEIDEVDSLVSGTFFFTGEEPSTGNMVEVSEGIFTHVWYTSLTPATPDDFLKTKIDGAEWEAASVTGIMNAGTLTLNGTNSDASKTVALTLPTPPPAGTYQPSCLL